MPCGCGRPPFLYWAKRRMRRENGVYASGRTLRALATAALLAGAGAAAADNTDCRDCHGAAAREPGASDFSPYYAEQVRHHPVGVQQPGGGNAAYRQPDARFEGLAFFDRNGNGQLDADEPRLSASATVECHSCHREHGGGEAPVVSPAAHLRMSNADSGLCLVCHRM